VAEVTSFLAAHRRYNVVPVLATDRDRYYDETAVVAEQLGATGVPRSRAEVRDYYAEVRSELGPSDASAELLEFLRRPLGRDPVTRAVYELFLHAAGAQLPGWARAMLDIRLPPGADRLVLRPTTWSVLQAMRLATGPSPVLAAARDRAMAVAP
jgi:uncharacterized protein (DUF2236 family)